MSDAQRTVTPPFWLRFLTSFTAGGWIRTRTGWLLVRANGMAEVWYG